MMVLRISSTLADSGVPAIGGGTIKGIENLTWVQGSNFADTIYARDNGTGYGEFNKVYGKGGNDIMGDLISGRVHLYVSPTLGIDRKSVV